MKEKTQMICSNISENEAGHLVFAGYDTTELAAEYGTPLYLLDEERIRANCRIYKNAFLEYFPNGSLPLYASKANSFKRIYEIMQEEGLGVDIVSSGEIITAVRGGFNMSNSYFHSNNKTDADIEYAIDCGIGYFVSDSIEEISAIERIAGEREMVQDVLLRVTPGIDPHTYEAVATGKVDSKFGSAIETGQADEITAYTLDQPHVRLRGFHCHVGSQVFGEDVFERTAAVMLEFVAEMKEKYGYCAEQLDLGGGYGVRYVDDDPGLVIAGRIADVAAVINKTCGRLGIEIPKIMMEPGRSIVADAGMTLYTVGSVKKIPGYKNYVSIDGGMTDNPRYALYGSRYTSYLANKMREECEMSADLVGRCCESGDIIQAGGCYPESVCRGDIVAVCTTGAYNYSMASNYNRIPRPPIVMLNNSGSYVAVRRETLEDIVRLDV